MLRSVVTGHPEDLDRVVSEIRRLSSELGFSDDRGHEIATAVVEALTNAMRHGHAGRRDRPIGVEARAERGELLVEVTDRGSGLIRIPDRPDLDAQLSGRERAGGWGIYLMCAFASRVRLIRTAGGHVTSLTFESSSPADPAVPVLEVGHRGRST